MEGKKLSLLSSYLYTTIHKSLFFLTRNILRSFCNQHLKVKKSKVHKSALLYLPPVKISRQARDDKLTLAAVCHSFNHSNAKRNPFNLRSFASLFCYAFRRWGILCILAIVFHSGEATSADSFEKIKKEPTITKKESEILNQVTEISKDNIPKAIDLLLTSLDEDSSAALDFALGNLYFQLNQTEQAQKWYKEALTKFPSFNRARSNHARILIQDAKYKEAFLELQQILKTDPEDHPTLLLIGFVLLAMDKPIAAENFYRKAIVLDPFDTDAYKGLAKALLLQERIPETQKLIKEILQINPYQEELWAILANGYMHLNRMDDAIVALECSTVLNKSTFNCLASLGDLYLHENLPELALKAFQKSIPLNEINPFRLLRAMEGLILQNDLERAEQLSQSLIIKETEIKKNPDLSKKWDQLIAQMEFLKGNSEKAIAIYKNLLLSDPLNGRLLLSLGDVFYAKNDLEQAKMYFEKALRSSDSKRDCLIKLAQIEARKLHYRKAIELLIEVQQLKYQSHIQRYLEQIKALESIKS